MVTKAKDVFDIAVDRFLESINRKDDEKITGSIIEEIVFLAEKENRDIPESIKTWLEESEARQEGKENEPEYVQYQMGCSIKLVFQNAQDREAWLQSAVLTDLQKGIKALNADYGSTKSSPELLFLVGPIHSEDTQDS